VDKTTKRVRRQMSGGELYAPALDLIALAKKLNRLDELSTLSRNLMATPRSPAIQAGVAGTAEHRTEELWQSQRRTE